MVAEFSNFYQAWVAAERRASQAERAFMRQVTEGRADRTQAEEVRALRAEASAHLRTMLAEAEKRSRICRPFLDETKCDRL